VLITKMREYARGLKFVLLLVIAAFLLTSVVYYGASQMSGSGGDPSTIATVNGERIPVERYRRAYQSYMEFYRQLYRDRLTPELAERLGLGRQVVNDLVQDALIVQQAEREGVRVTDDELRTRIQTIPAFQEDGRFSHDRYVAVLRQVRFDPGAFEAEQRREMVRRKMDTLVREGAKVSEAEVREAWGTRNDRIRAAWAMLEIEPLLAQATVNEADAEAYLKLHQARFTRPERRRIQYAVVSSRAFAEPISDTDAEAYYKEHGTEFERPRRAKVAHVLVRVPPTGGGAAEERAKAKAQEVIRRAQAGEDFAKLAREMSEDTATAPNGGELGLVGPGEMVPPFEQAAFALKKGEVTSSPVRTTFGYHAIKVLDVQEGGRQPFKEAVARIKEKLLAERSERAAARRAEEARGTLQGSADFLADSRKLGLEGREVSLARGEPLEGVGRDAPLEDAIFGLAVAGVSPPVKTAGGYVIARVVEQSPAGVPPLAEIKKPVLDAMRREAAEKVAFTRATALTEAVGRGEDFAAAARAQSFTVGETDYFSRSEPPKDKTSLPGNVLQAALGTAVGKVAKPLTAGSGVYVVRTLERQPADPAGFEAQKDELRRQILTQKQGQALEAWVRALRASAKIDLANPEGAPAPR
jgi:peptidyl-prolyl cis-trans isomerase D